jgi:hypothetical protein
MTQDFTASLIRSFMLGLTVPPTLLARADEMPRVH